MARIMTPREGIALSLSEAYELRELIEKELGLPLSERGLEMPPAEPYVLSRRMLARLNALLRWPNECED
jgi:hypothetical protein